MSPTLHADLPLAARLETAGAMRNVEYARALRFFDPLSGAAWEEMGGGHVVFTGIESPLSRAFGIGLAGSVAHDEIDRLERFYGERGMPVVLDLAPFADEALVDELGRRGYRYAEPLNVLARSLDRDDDRCEMRDDIVVRHVDEEDAEIWIDTVGRGFAEGGAPARGDREIFHTSFHAASSHCFLALLDGAIAGGAMAVVRDGVALFGATSVLPEFRGRGVHAMMIRERLAFARSLGCDLAMMGARPGSASQRNVERHHFQVVYTKAKLIGPAPIA